MFKLLVLVGVIYAVYRISNLKKITPPHDDNDNGEEFVDYEEVD